jgi:hypothetical protein
MLSLIVVMMEEVQVLWKLLAGNTMSLGVREGCLL